jgi:hypothetical protein
MNVSIDLILGHIQLVPVQKVEEGHLYFGAYSITYDRNGQEISRTEPSYSCYLVEE